MSAPDAAAWFRRGEALGAQGRDAEAEEAFREAARLAPAMPQAHFNLALAQGYQRKWRGAVESFLEARRLQSDLPGLDAVLLDALLQLLQSEPAAPAPMEMLPALAAAPLVSVVVPTRNRPRLLADALASIARQSYPRWEAIVVNDDGEDVGAALARAGARERLRLERLPRREGQAGARNRGLALARGEVLAFLDDDDLFLPDHLETLVRALGASGAGLAYTHAQAVRETLRDGARVELERGLALPHARWSRRALLVRNFIPVATWGIRRECLQRWGGFDASLACAEDWELLLRLSARTPFHEVDALTAEVRLRDTADRVSTSRALRPACEALYARYDDGGDGRVRLARELYLASLA